MIKNDSFEVITTYLKDILYKSHKLEFIKNLILIIKIKSLFSVSGFYKKNLLLYKEYDQVEFKNKQFDILNEIIEKMQESSIKFSSNLMCVNYDLNSNSNSNSK